MSEPVFVAFATQKGGVGKSTLTALVASYLYYVDGVDVLAIDCDERQHSLNEYRQKDTLIQKENPIVKRNALNFYQKFKKKSYQILLTSPADAIEVAMDYLKKDESPKVVFFDITGTINDLAIVNLLSRMDYLFVPITTDTADMKSSLRFSDHVVNRMMTMGKTRIKDLRLLWNRIPSRTKPKLCELVDESMEELGLHSLDTVLVNSSRFFKDGATSGRACIFRSTMLPPDKQLLKGSNLPELVKEIRGIINV